MMIDRRDEEQGQSNATNNLPGNGVVVRENTTKLKLLLPVGKERAWELIATSEGLASWLPAACIGRVAVGELLAFRWNDGSVEQFRVRSLGEKHSSVRLDWRHGAELRFYLHGRLTTLTVEVEYRNTTQGGKDQVRELPIWGFRLANLKSVAVRGHDLRSRSTEPRRSWKVGFIDV
jgi:hypothetical protein